MGLIGTPGTMDKVDDENPMPLFMREGMSKSCYIGIHYIR